jgi:hypothetical protein
MTTALLDTPVALEPRRGQAALSLARPRGDSPADGGSTLGEFIAGACEALAAGQPVACPVCSGRMLPTDGATGRAAGGCLGCGSQLS